MNEKEKNEIKKKLNRVLNDERLWYECADVYSNAPLALIQMGLETERDTLLWVLNLKYSDIKKIDKLHGEIK